jgi:hypothetical protein
MKVFVIGGTSSRSPVADTDLDYQLLATSMEHVGRDLAVRGHDLLVCSPFTGSADIAAVRGAATFLQEGPTIEFHHPDSEAVRKELQRQIDALGLKRVKTFAYFPLPEETGEPRLSALAWLLAQLAAMDRSHALIALGGKADASASLLLALAESRHKPVLPLTFLGGAAASSFERIRYQLNDRLGAAVPALHDPHRVGEAVGLIERLATGAVAPVAARAAPSRFFISYPRLRPQEADFIETVLRRRRLEAYRDERDFAAGHSLPGEIKESIHRADVFIAIWCREYACSPWCFDELQLALERHKGNGLALWLMCVDDTRMVHPAARSLISYSSRTREELERNLLTLLERGNPSV